MAIPLYRVLRTKRTTDGDFEISALQYEPSKFAYIDTGARLEERPISVIPITVVPAPTSVTVVSNSAVVQGLSVATMTISWPAVAGAVGYDIEWRKDSGNWIKLQRTGMTSVDVVGIYAGAYVARVRAVSAFDISLIWRASILTHLKGKEGLPPALSYLTATPLLFGIYLKWGFPAGAEGSQRTERRRPSLQLHPHLRSELYVVGNRAVDCYEVELMSFGLQYTNNANTVIIDSEFARLMVISSGRFAPTEEGGLGSTTYLCVR